MGKLGTTTTVTDDNGNEHTFGPNDKDDLPGWAQSKLAESWPADREDLWGDAAPKAKAAAKPEGDKPPAK